MVSFNRLTRHYDDLSPRQRFALRQRAVLRRDDVERDRLDSSDTPQAWELPSFHGVAVGLAAVTESYVTSQLETLVLYWRAETGICEELESEADGDGDPEAQGGSADWLELAWYMSYVFATRRAAWKQFCDELQVDHIAVVKLRSPLVSTAREIPESDETPEEIRALCPRRFSDPSQQPVTVDHFLDEFRELFRYREKQWT